jgi:hypothetical protein
MTTMPVVADAALAEELPVDELPPLTGWRWFLSSWWMGAILLVALGGGVTGIVSAHPFGSPSASERISHAIGQPASCVSVGAQRLAGESRTIYRCTTVGLSSSRNERCFTITNGNVRQLGARRESC